MADLVTSQEVKDYLGISGSGEDTLIGALIDYASNAIENYCNTYFSSTAITDRLDGGGRYLITKVAPIISVTSITDAYDSTVVSSADYLNYLAAGLIYIDVDTTNYALQNLTWAEGMRRWIVVYNAGYASVPNAVKLACILLVSYFRTTRTPGMLSETVGDYSYTKMQLPDAGLPEEVKMLLAPYRRKVI